MASGILLVDDNAIQAATRKAILERAGRNVLVANSAAAGLTALENPEIVRSLGLIITDHLMPEMNGPQFVSLVRIHFPEMPVLVLSGLPDAETEYEGMDVVFRVKPFAPDQLILLVKMLMNEPMTRTA
jgi:DNA-binding NtrC family response regulator